MDGETPGGSNGQTCIKNDHDASTATDAGAGLKTSTPAPLSRAAVFAFSPFSSLSFSFFPFVLFWTGSPSAQVRP